MERGLTGRGLNAKYGPAQLLFEVITVWTCVFGFTRQVRWDHASFSPSHAFSGPSAATVQPFNRSTRSDIPLPSQDHCKPCYLPDLVLAEESGLVVPGTWWVWHGGCGFHARYRQTWADSITQRLSYITHPTRLSYITHPTRPMQIRPSPYPLQDNRR